MSYQDKTKNCFYCHKEFKPIRISAKYCSPSCRSMDNRRKKNPEVYRHYNPVHLEYEDEAYRALLHKMKALNHATPEAFLSELVKEMVSNNMISFFLNTEQENVLKYVLNFQYPDHNFQEALKTWVVTRSEKEAIAIKKGRMKR